MSECRDFVCTMGDVYVLMAAAGFILWGGHWLWVRRTPERRSEIRYYRELERQAMIDAYLRASSPRPTDKP